MGKAKFSVAAVQGVDGQIPRRYPNRVSAANLSVAAVQGFEGQIPRPNTTRNRLLAANLVVAAVQGVDGQIPRGYLTRNRPLAVNLSVAAVQDVDVQVTRRYPTRVSATNLSIAAAQGVEGQICRRYQTSNRVSAVHEQIPRRYPTRNWVSAVQSAQESCGSGSSKVGSCQKKVKRKREEGNQKEKKKKMEKEVVARRQVVVALEHCKLMGEENLSVAAVQGDDGQVPRRYPTRNRVSAANLSVAALQGVEGQNSGGYPTRDHVSSLHEQLPRRYPTRNWESTVQSVRESCNSGSSKVGGSRKKVKRKREEGNQKEKKKMVKEVVTRRQVRVALSMFQMIYRKLRKQGEAKLRYPGEGLRIVKQAYMIFKGKNNMLNSRKYVGSVPGVEIGDEFQFRAEVSLTNLHGEIHGPVDFTNIDGRNVAISLVSVSSYANYLKSSTVLFYSSAKEPSRKAEHSNLALKNSIAAKIPVRVIRGIRYGDVITYTYDGLFSVKKCKTQKLSDGRYVFVFELRRMQGQPEVSITRADSRRYRKIAGLRIEDISSGEEKIPIPVVNILDDELPMPFEYTTKLIYPPDYQPPPPRGCDCTDGCTDTKKCACAVKNGGEIPFNHDGDLVEAKPLVYECGPSCKCPPSCHNRVSQNGIKFPLEIFKTERMGWGVRCMTAIPSGSFVCEYTGELLEDEEAQKRSSDVYLFAIGNNYYNKSLWEGLKTFIPDLQKNNGCDVVEDGGFTIDASRNGNVCRFINHSCTPNLYAQNLLRDHDDKTKPRVALFATENIPPLQELTYDYNYAIGQVHDSNGNIRKQDCYCGSEECIGRVY